jgi:hypothetical protein
VANQGQVDIGRLAEVGQRYELAVTGGESPEDAAARRTTQLADSKLARQIRLLLVVFALLLTSAIFAGCLATFVGGTPDDKKWAAGIVSAIASGLVGFLVGQGKGAK